MNPDIGLHHALTTENCFVFNSGAALKTCNRVCHKDVPTEKEINDIKSLFGSLQFTWFVDSADYKSHEILKNNGLKYKASFPAMAMDLKYLNLLAAPEEIFIKEIDLDNHFVQDWTQIISQSFGAKTTDLSQMLTMFAERAPHAVKLYLGFYQGIAVTAGMFINHGRVVSLHWIGTLLEGRKKGVATVLTQKALFDFKQLGCETTVLIATSSGKPLYERIGFTEYAHYDVYGNY
jgi:ribosomal protein S18 acetylase RimI-like enzyme